MSWNAPRPTLTAGDFDGDGDLDVLVRTIDTRCCGHESGNRIEWYVNIDGRGNFGQGRVISDDSKGAYSVHAADLDSDGDLDIFTSAEWYENTDGLGNFGPPRSITSEFGNYGGADAADLDGDGDLDVVSADHFGMGRGTVSWYENQNGRGSFRQGQVIAGGWATGEPHDVHAVDVDGDGDFDVIATHGHNQQQVVWYENTDGKGDFEAAHIIYDAVDRGIVGPDSVSPADVDGDGDVDVVVTFHGSGEVVWFENTDGNGNFLAPNIITKETEWFNSAIPLDADGDGDVDVVSAP